MFTHCISRRYLAQWRSKTQLFWIFIGLFFLNSSSAFSVDVYDLKTISKKVLDTNGYSGDVAINPVDGSLHVAWVTGGDIYYQVKHFSGTWGLAQKVPDGNKTVWGVDFGFARKCLGIDIDEQGKTHVAFSIDNGDIYYVSGFPGNWSTPVRIVDKEPYSIHIEIAASAGKIVVAYEDSTPDQIYTIMYRSGRWRKPMYMWYGEYPCLYVDYEDGTIYLLSRGSYKANNRNPFLAYLRTDTNAWLINDDISNADTRLGAGPGLGIGSNSLFVAWSNSTGKSGPQKSELFCSSAQKPGGGKWTYRKGGNAPIIYENTGDPHPRAADYNTMGNKMSLDVECDGKTVWVVSSLASRRVGEVAISGITNPQAEYFNPRFSDDVEDFDIIAKTILDNNGYSGSIAINPQNGSLHTVWVHNGDLRYRVRSLGGTWGSSEALPDAGTVVAGEEGSSWPRMCVDLDVDDNGVSHVVFAEEGGDLYYLSGTQSSWGTPLQIVNKSAYTIYPKIKVVNDNVVVVYEDANDNDIYTVVYQNNVWGDPTWLTEGEYPSLEEGNNGKLYFLCRTTSATADARFGYQIPGFTEWTFVDNVTNASDVLGSGPGMVVGNGKIYLSWNNNTGVSGPYKSEMFCAFANEPGLNWTPSVGNDFPLFYENTSDPHPRVAVYSDGKVLYLNGKRLEERFMVVNEYIWTSTRTAPWNDGIPDVVSDGRTAWVMVSSTSNISDEVSVTGITNPDAVQTDYTNHMPAITSEPDTFAMTSQLWTYQCQATDSDGDPITYTLLESPTGMIISGSGLLQWTPSQSAFTGNPWGKGQGVHLVGIRAKDDADAKDFQYFWIHVEESVGANFSSSTTEGTVPFAVQFQDQSTGTITSYLWDFGDDSTSTEANPSHTYELSGIFTVQLTVTGPGGSDDEIKTDYITVNEPGPIAKFGADTTWGATPLTVQFSDSSEGVITSWLWAFGDDSTSTEQHPSHCYGYAGNYTVQLTVTGPGGSDDETKTNLIMVEEGLMAGFWADLTSGIAPLTVIFTDTSKGNITSWLWDFGDDSTSAEQHPSYTYEMPGTYTVQLFITGPAGSDVETRNQYITAIDGSPTANFGVDTTQGHAPLTVQFSDSSEGDITTWVWDFGDQTTSSLQNPSHVYTTPGNYTVQLSLTGPYGSGTEIKTDYITILEDPPVANFTADTTNGEIPFFVRFSDQSTGGVTSWLWDFGDGSSSLDPTPLHMFFTAGQFTVSLTVTGPGGSDTFSQDNFITTTSPSGIVDAGTIPDSYHLHQSFPNPFNATTTISYDLPEQAKIKITAFDMTGKQIAVIENGVKSAGRYNVIWHAQDGEGHELPTGVYIIRLTTGGYSSYRKSMLLK